MVNDQELADKIVALGVGYRSGPHAYGIFLAEGTSERIGEPELFVRDWRVAGALMERCAAVDIDTIGNPWWVAALRHEKPEKWFKAKGESLPRAIVEAGIGALT